MHENVTYFTYQTPFGPVTLAENDHGLIFLSPGDLTLKGTRRASALLNKAANELQEYFAKKRTSFDIPLAPVGTAFEQQVWQELTHISYGNVINSSELASALDNPKATQAVSRAAKKNPIPIFIPHHRLETASPDELVRKLREIERNAS